MKNIKHYYAFRYLDGLNTTSGDYYWLAGELHRFITKQKRDEFVEDNHYGYCNNQKPCHALSAREARKVKYAGGVSRNFDGAFFD